MAERSVNRRVNPDLEAICQRIREKSESYDQYNFSSRYNDLLKAFFDLSQEYDSLDDFCRICVAVPLEMTGFSCSLYLFQEKNGDLQLVCDSALGLIAPPETAPPEIHMLNTPYETDRSYVVPIYSRSIFHAPTEDAAKDSWFILHGLDGKTRIFGMFEIKHRAGLSNSDRFFFQKYCNRIGYNLHNRLILHQNISHLKFINNLVMDIEHNIIVPNMYFKHIFNQLKKKIDELNMLKERLKKLLASCANREDSDEALLLCDDIYNQLLAYHGELVKHHANTSLFLESLFRREHFKKGHLVLRTKRCFVEKEIILPQLEHYASRLRAANISIDRPQNMLEEEFEILVDVGLLAQVYANFFSNAAKYTQEVIDHHGRPRKAMAYGRELVEDFPVKGQQGIKFNVFTTGANLNEDEALKLFEEGVRGPGSENVPGTGHGLAFIKHVIELHGGKVGYEPTGEGNNFYFILPVPPKGLSDNISSR
ncbi:MAG: HAMP domain-containing sensor histidine kinase [Desulfobulbaceae bacterium]|nr:HAMP domain-containing sensor histidine kinase [Desulfobulbaceae bacterium]